MQRPLPTLGLCLVYRRAPATRERVQARTRELAIIAGRVPPHVIQSDYEQAKREVTGESDFDRQEAVLKHFPDANYPGLTCC